ncbi:TraB/GumN family protein, partial [Candidatus Poribacteria bacterium]|nr:TraB/GumN family protein [Candidatus Poribacteria bacterium]
DREAAMRQQLPAGGKLADRLPPELLARVDAFLKGKGLSLESVPQIQSTKPWSAAEFLRVMDWVAAFEVRSNIEGYLFDYARNEGKPVTALTRLEDRLDTLDALSAEEQMQLLEGWLGDREGQARSGRNRDEEIIGAFLRGDENAVRRLALEPYKLAAPVFVKLRNKVFAQHERDLASRIAAELGRQPGKRLVFTADAAHLAGGDGVLDQLKSKGLKITRVTGNEEGAK